MPVAKLNKQAIAAEYDRIGDAGILRGFVWGDQAGCWQHACCLMAVEELILECFDNPDWVHRLLRTLLERKLRFIEESLTGAKFDLIETGGGAGSDTVISPKLHREFCLPYDRQMHDALHAVGHRSTYHTCGGMMHILDLIVANDTDASETLAPPGVGGNITEPDKVRAVFGGKVAMIGGMDQFNILTTRHAGGNPAGGAPAVRRLRPGRRLHLLGVRPFLRDPGGEPESLCRGGQGMPLLKRQHVAADGSRRIPINQRRQRRLAGRVAQVVRW